MEHSASTGTAVSDITVGYNYNATKVYTINSGELPAGLSLNATTGAITGVPGKEPYKIDATKCIKCGTCISVCRFGAVHKE